MTNTNWRPYDGTVINNEKRKGFLCVEPIALRIQIQRWSYVYANDLLRKAVLNGGVSTAKSIVEGAQIIHVLVGLARKHNTAWLIDCCEAQPTHNPPRMVTGKASVCDNCSIISIELESSSEEENNASRLTRSTGQCFSSHLIRRHKNRHKQHNVPRTDIYSTFHSFTDSVMSPNIVTVTLNMENYNFLGISIMDQSNDCNDGGNYISSIMKGGAVAAEGKIEQGDMLLQVNDVNFENKTKDAAVRILGEMVCKNGLISLTVAKSWDPSPRSYVTIPRVFDLALLAGRTEMATIVKMMQLPDSGLEIKDRMWLKMTIANGVIGADVVDWLYSRVDGFRDRHDARKYASRMLKHGYLRHIISKITFSEQCYYMFCQRDTHSITVHLL